MRFLVIVSVVLASALGQEFLYGTAELQAARAAFFEEYERLAKLAELAPDIHLIYKDPLEDSDRPAVSHTYSFSTSLGKDHRFRPHPKTTVALKPKPQPPTLEAEPALEADPVLEAADPALEAGPVLEADPALEAIETSPQEESVPAAVEV